MPFQHAINVIIVISAFQCICIDVSGQWIGEKCEFVRYCINCTCTHNEYESSPLLITTNNETTCYKELEALPQTKAVEYLAQKGTCFIYSNIGGLSFAEGHVTFIKTCHSGNFII